MSKPIRLTFRNYRGFTESDPLVLEVRSGFTAIVGRNNSGKSAAKLAFYELRNLFRDISHDLAINPSIRSVLSTNGQLHVDYLGVTDIEEIFNNQNDRQLVLEMEFLDAATPAEISENSLRRVVATCQRESPRMWSLGFFGAAAPTTEIRNFGRIGPHSVNTIHVGGRSVDCADFIKAMQVIAGARYYGPFRNAINEGAGDYYDLRVGTSFIDLWKEWKTSGVKHKSRAIDQVTEDIRRLFDFKRLEISASDNLKTLMVSVDGQPYRLNELGSGLAQFIMVLGNAATNPASILLIDEPETHLHPALQIDFLSSVARYADVGIIFSTHSIGLARSVAQQIYSIQKRDGRSLIKRFEETPNYVEFIGELSFSTFKDLGSDRVLLVEGVNDVLVVQQLLRLVGKDHTTVILPLGGDQLATGREAELHELTRLSNSIIALVDSERTSEAGPIGTKRQAFKDVCEKLSIPVCITDLRAIENYFPDRAVKAALGSSYSAIGPFDALKDATKPWGKTENWKIARQLDWGEIADTDVGRFLKNI